MIMSEKNFIMNEYLEVNVNQDLLQLCSDCYRAMGWIIINTSNGIGTVTLKLQRDRKIKNRTALCDLQRKCEEAFKAIEGLEKSKTKNAMAASLGIGLLGTIFMAGSTFAYLGGFIPLCVVLAIPGFGGWMLPYFLYKKIEKQSINKVIPMIDQNYDVIYEACEKATNLLN
jgi:hypothetical protein